MRPIAVTLWMSLDGVVQGLGRPDEDTRGGFMHGGWGTQYNDEVMAREMGKAMSQPGDMLFGRRTWEDFIGAWAHGTDGNPITERMNATTKYVVSRSGVDVGAWENSVLLQGEAVERVSELKAQPGAGLGIVGSASLVRTLHNAGLIDRYTLLICPLTLGSGARLFEEPAPLRQLQLVKSVVTTKGVIITEYVPR
jgi:dihydrofolate reductase